MRAAVRPPRAALGRACFAGWRGSLPEHPAACVERGLGVQGRAPAALSEAQAHGRPSPRQRGRGVPLPGS
jgi:hypothetical protein